MTVMGFELHSLRLEINRLLREHREARYRQAAQDVSPAERARAATGYLDFLRTLTAQPGPSARAEGDGRQ